MLYKYNFIVNLSIMIFLDRSLSSLSHIIQIFLVIEVYVIRGCIVKKCCRICQRFIAPVVLATLIIIIYSAFIFIG